jgi:hypothetical protein
VTLVVDGRGCIEIEINDNLTIRDYQDEIEIELNGCKLSLKDEEMRNLLAFFKMILRLGRDES